MGTFRISGKRHAGHLILASAVKATPLPIHVAPNFELELLEARRLLSGFGDQGWTHVNLAGGAGGAGVPYVVVPASNGQFYVGGGAENIMVSLDPPGAQILTNLMQDKGLVSIARLNTDGTPDTSFGTDGSGTVSVDFGMMSMTTADHILIQPDGKLVVTAETPQGLGIVRLNSDGSVDTSFGGGPQILGDFNGFSITEIDGEDSAWLMPNGEVELMGMNGPDLVTLRLKADGNPDQSFGTDGAVSTTIDPNGDELAGDNLDNAEELSGGGVLAYADIWSYAPSTDGNPDDQGPPEQQLVQVQLDDNGNVTSQQTINLALNLGNQWYGDFAIGPDVVMASDGSAFVSTGSDPSVEKLLPSGQPDTSFGVQGVAALPGQSTQVETLTADGKLFVQNGPGNPYAWGEQNGIVRLNADGSLDTSFNNGQPTAGGVYAVTALPDDTTLLVYPSGDLPNAVFVIEKINDDGSPVTDTGSSLMTEDAAALAIIAKQNGPNPTTLDNGLFRYVPGTSVWDPNGDQGVLDNTGST